MRYNLNKMLKRQGLVHLQGMGEVPGKPAAELKAGDFVGYNFGYADQVETVEDVSAAFVLVTFASGFDQKFKKDRLVAIPQKPHLWTRTPPKGGRLIDAA